MGFCSAVSLCYKKKTKDKRAFSSYCRTVFAVVWMVCFFDALVLWCIVFCISCCVGLVLCWCSYFLGRFLCGGVILGAGIFGDAVNFGRCSFEGVIF